MDLNSIWFVLVAVLIAGYAILDGFDLGVGVLHLFAKSDEERALHLQSIGPVWDGNEVWLLTAGGALFAAFPVVYATVFSGFYLALMLLLLGLILRAVSVEFHHLLEEPGWRRFFDWGFGLGSLIPGLLLGVAVGNVLRGLPIDARGEWAGSFLGLLNPYSLLVGVVGLSFFVMHGAVWLHLKTSGALAERMRRWGLRLWSAWLAAYVAATVATAFVAPQLFDRVTHRPLFWAMVAGLAVAAVGIPHQLSRGNAGGAFLASSATIVFMIGLAGLSLFPTLVPSRLAPEASLTIYNASSSQKTLVTMLVIALIGMPLVIGYTALVHRVFRGKVAAGTGPAT